jgi:hypothetical protein
VVAAPVDLGEFFLGSGEADLEALDFAEPALAVGFGDAGYQVVADLGDAGPLGGVWPVQGTPQAAVLVDARRAERPPADAGGDLSAFEVAEELGPFLVGNPGSRGGRLRRRVRDARGGRRVCHGRVFRSRYVTARDDG